VQGRPGETVVAPLLLSPTDGLETADLTIAYEAQRLGLLNVCRGRLTTDFALFAFNTDPLAGTVRVGLGRSAGAITGQGAGNVLELVLRIKPDAAGAKRSSTCGVTLPRRRRS
jgi:hypothetical protein